MQTLSKPYARAAVAALSALILGFGAVALGSLVPTARASSIGQLRQAISAGRGAISSLSATVGAESGRIGQLRAVISRLERKIARIQTEIDVKRAELLKLQAQLQTARTRLHRLVAFDKRAEVVLSQQLVTSYESDSPDLVSVVLDSTGFQDLLERLSFQKRIRSRNVTVINQVRAARRAVAAQATRLGKLEVRQQSLTEQVVIQRNQLASTRITLVNQELSVARSRGRTAAKLAGVRGRVSDLQHRLERLQAEEAARAAAATRAAAQAAAQSSPAVAAATSNASVSPSQVSSAGGFTFPLPRGSVVGPGSWSLDDGVDMSAPGDTPEFAVCSGTIVLHGIGGFGPSAPVIHCDNSLSGYSYVYYGHTGPADQLPVGTHVSAGQVMSSVGPGIVGISTGPHIEIGFCDSSGNPVGPSSAGAMMSLLRRSY